MCYKEEILGVVWRVRGGFTVGVMAEYSIQQQIQKPKIKSGLKKIDYIRMVESLHKFIKNQYSFHL